LPGAIRRRRRLIELARRLRALPVMTQTRNAILRNFSDLANRRENAAGQKARGGWQALPGARLMEGRACL
jgi:hypothetical protein